MRHVSIREVRSLLPELEQALAAEGDLILTRHGKPIARVTGVSAPAIPLSTAGLRAQMKRVAVSSAVLIRQERDER